MPGGEQYVRRLKGENITPQSGGRSARVRSGNGAGMRPGRRAGGVWADGHVAPAELPDLHRQEGVRGRRGMPTGPDLYFRVTMPVSTAQRETGWEGR